MSKVENVCKNCKTCLKGSDREFKVIETWWDNKVTKPFN